MADHALQRAAGGQKIGFGLRPHHVADEAVHGRVLDAGQIARVFGVRGLAAEQVGVFLPGVGRARISDGGDVEVEGLQALLVEREVHRAVAELDAQLVQVANPGRHHAGAGLVAVQVVQHHGLALRVLEHAALHAPARFAQQLLCTAQVLAQAVGALVGARRLEGGAEGGGGDVLAVRLHQRHLRGVGLADGRALGVAEQALDPAIRAVEHLPVHPLEVDRQAQRLAHAHVLQEGPARVEHVALKAGGQLVLELALDQLAALELGAVHAPRPVAGRIKRHQVELAGLQRLQPRGVVAVDLDLHAVEVARAALDVQVARPVGRVAHIGDVLAEVDRADAVGPAADGRLHHHLVEGFALPPVAAEHRQAAHRERQLAVGLAKAKAHGALVQHVRAGHIDQQRLVRRRDKGAHERVEAVFDVGGQHRRAVMKARLTPQPEAGRQAVGRHLHVLGQQAVGGALLVQRASEQCVEHQLRQIGGRVALDGEGVVLVEGGGARVAHQPDLAALGRIGVDVVEVGKARRVLQVTPQRIAGIGPARKAKCGK